MRHVLEAMDPTNNLNNADSKQNACNAHLSQRGTKRKKETRLTKPLKAKPSADDQDPGFLKGCAWLSPFATVTAFPAEAPLGVFRYAFPFVDVLFIGLRPSSSIHSSAPQFLNSLTISQLRMRIKQSRLAQVGNQPINQSIN
mmetsp:Transcript_16900/g.32972  ORF Transcript_16900/g.32972 Transcript_16900/m.32972 type:complete len:142 (+) Transcript_16900:387-812(+)